MIRILVLIVGGWLSVWATASEGIWIDVRTAAEFRAGHLAEVDHHIPHQSIVAGVQALNLAQDAEILLYCRTGNRSGLAQQALQQAGYTQVRNMGSLEDARRYVSRGLSD